METVAMTDNAVGFAAKVAELEGKVRLPEDVCAYDAVAYRGVTGVKTAMARIVEERTNVPEGRTADSCTAGWCKEVLLQCGWMWRQMRVEKRKGRLSARYERAERLLRRVGRMEYPEVLRYADEAYAEREGYDGRELGRDLKVRRWLEAVGDTCKAMEEAYGVGYGAAMAVLAAKVLLEGGEHAAEAVVQAEVAEA